MPMCRRASNMWKPEPGPSSIKPQLQTISDMDAQAIGNPDANSRKTEPKHHRRERLRSFTSPLCFVKIVLRLLYRNQ